MPERKEIDLSKRCVSDLVGPELLVSTSAYFCKMLRMLIGFSRMLAFSVSVPTSFNSCLCHYLYRSTVPPPSLHPL